jgi:transposase
MLLFSVPRTSSEMRLGAGFKLIYLPLYSPDLKTLEEFLSDLKAICQTQVE